MSSSSIPNEPNWKVDADYAYTAQLDDQGWAWEFLRRNPEYREDWAKYCTWKAPLEKEYGKVDGWSEITVGAVAKLWQYSPTKLAEESDDAWRQRATDIAYRVEKVLRPVAWGRAWGLKVMSDPSLSPCPSGFEPRGEPPIWR